MNCKDAILELSNYIDGDIDVAMRQQLEVHFDDCKDCLLLITQTRITIEIFSRDETFDVPSVVRARLHEMLRQKMGGLY